MKCRLKVCIVVILLHGRPKSCTEDRSACALRRQAMDARRKAQRKASSLPSQEAAKSLEKHMKEMIAPFIAEVRTLKAGLQKKQRCPEANPLRARHRSSQESR